MTVVAEAPSEPLAPGQIPEGRGRCHTIGGRAVAVFNAAGQLHAVNNRYPHTGGPLSLGRLTTDKQCVECPWHGARFKLATGEHAGGP